MDAFIRSIGPPSVQRRKTLHGQPAVGPRVNFPVPTLRKLRAKITALHQPAVFVNESGRDGIHARKRKERLSALFMCAKMPRRTK